MEYQDLTIDLRSTEGGGFEARIAEAPLRDNPLVRFPAPLDEATVELVHCSFDVAGAQLRAATSPRPVSSRQIGEQVFAGLFKNGLGEHLRRCRDAVCRDDDRGLRVRLRFRTDDTEAAYLAALPWEWMWDRRTGEYLALDRCTPVVREIAAPRWRATLEVEPPLRILVVDAAPATMQELELKLEIERMKEALGPLVRKGEVELIPLAKVTPEGLRDAVLDEGIHVLHFMGHGGYSRDSGTGAIFFIQDDGTKDQVDGEALAAFLKRSPDLRLVVLNACKTARHAGHKGAPSSYGVAAALLEQTRVPAVIANQYSISDDTAIAWSERFYGRLAKGDGVEEAMTEARLLLWRKSVEWATPVLFLNGREGRILVPKVPRRKGQRGTASSRPPRLEPKEIRLGVRSIDGYGRDMKSRNDHVLDLVPYFNGRYIKDKAWWQEKVFPDLRDFLRRWVVEGRPLGLDFAAHSSIAFAAGWLLEPKSGLDVRVRQRTSDGEFEWHPYDGSEPEGALWLNRPDMKIHSTAPDLAAALSVSQRNVAEQARHFIQYEGLPIGRIVSAIIAPEPGVRSVHGGAHALRLAQALLPRLQLRRPHERVGRVHFFCSAPNAVMFYLGQLASTLGRVVIYEYPFRAEDAYGRYQKSIELPPPNEVERVPPGW